MSNHPIFIDNVAFAKKNERLVGSLTLADCPRLAELLQDATKNVQSINNGAGLISYTLQGETNSIGQHYLHLTLNASLTTACQRCLQDMPLELMLSFDYLIDEISDTEVGEGDIDGSDDVDLQEASQTMDIITLIEDEIIMAMPIAPIHAEGCGVIVSQSGEKPNPFAVLKGLIKP